MSLLFIDGIGEHFVPAAKQLFIKCVAIFAWLSLKSFLSVLEHLILLIVFFILCSQLLGINFLASGYLFSNWFSTFFFVFFSALILDIKFSGGRYIQFLCLFRLIFMSSFIFISITLIIVLTPFTFILKAFHLFFLWIRAAVSRVKDRDVGSLANRFEIELF